MQFMVLKCFFVIELKCNLWMIVYQQLILYHNPLWSQNHGFKMFLRLTIEVKCNLWMIVYRQLILYHNPLWRQNNGFKMFLRLNNKLLVLTSIQQKILYRS